MSGIEIVYVYPLVPSCQPGARTYAERFVSCYSQFSPGIDHRTTVVLNGGGLDRETECMFFPLANVNFLHHDDSGYDIGAYQAAARQSSADLCVFFGTSTYFKRAGWLLRMFVAHQKHGPGLYGAHANRGDGNVGVFPHLRTTGFWLSPKLMNAYPVRVITNAQRYPFEHGSECLAEWIRKQGLPRKLVTFSGEFDWAEWDSAPEGFHRGTQSELLCGDRLSEPPYYHCQ